MLKSVLFFCAMENLYLDKENTLVNLSNSILNFFNIPTFHPTLKKVDEILAKTKKEKIALVLFDGFGKVIADYYKNDIPYIYSHKKFEFLSIFPPTTVAATTTVTTGLYPYENGHVGWTQYFKKHSAPINVFSSNDKREHSKIYPSVQQNILKPTYIWELLNASQKVNATSISSFLFKNHFKEDDFDKFFEEADKLIKTHDFVYVYSSNPDHLLHDNGRFNNTIKENLIYLESKLKILVEENKDTLFLLVADHGFMDVEEISIKEHEDFFDTLAKPFFVIEGSFASFFVKNKEKFKELANKYYGEYFYIYSKEELLNNGLLGEGNKHPNLDETLGDYFLISKDKYTFYDADEPIGFKGGHAGGNKCERELYLFAFNE